MKRVITGCVVFGLLMVAGLAAQQQRPQDIEFQIANRTETVDRNFKLAVEQFKAIVNKYGKIDRPVAARAQLRVAKLYERLKDPQARAAYVRLASDFGDQPIAAEARAWLTITGQDAVSQRGRTEPSKERLAIGGPRGRPSREGHIMPFVHEGWNLGVRDLATGKDRVLTTDGGVGGSGAWYPIASRDGLRIAYMWVKYAKKSDGYEDVSTLRIIDSDGSHLREVGPATSMNLYDWSPDGRQLAAIRGIDETTSAVVIVSTGDATTTQLFSKRNSQVLELGGFSPDGKWLSYALSKDANTGEGGGVFLMATDGSRNVTLASGPSTFGAPFWTPDGSRVVFTSNRSGTNDLWSLNAGPAQAEPVRLRANVGSMKVLGLTADGGLHYSEQAAETEAYISTLDTRALIASQPVRVSNLQVGVNSEPVISPDGRFVAFLRTRGRDGIPVSGGRTEVVARSFATGEERVLTSLAEAAYRAQTLQWFPDSQSLLVQDQVDRRKRFRRVSFDIKEERTLFEGPWDIWTSALSPDGKTLFYSLKEDETLRLVKRNLSTGIEQDVHREVNTGSPGFYGLSLSPDGQQFVFTLNGVRDGQRALFTLPVSGGVPRRIHDFREDRKEDWIVPEGAMAWTSDSKTIVFTGYCGPMVSPSSDSQLCAIPATGGELHSLGLRLPFSLSRVISSDGKRIAFSTSSSTNELWVMRNVLAP